MDGSSTKEIFLTSLGLEESLLSWDMPQVDEATRGMRALPGQVGYSASPLVTIAIPTHNRAALLHDSVASALAQTYPNIEVLVSNNASTDDTSAVLRSFNDPRLREIVNPENFGLIRNWNQCVHQATGEYLVILSDDNLLQPTFLEKCIALLQQEPGLPIVAGGFDVVMTTENRTVPAVLSQKLKTGIWDGTDILVEHLRGNFSCGTLSAAVRTDILQRNGGFPAEHMEGGEELVLCRIFLEGRAGLINEPCASHLFHTHPTARHSANLDIDSRFCDLCSVMDELSEAADHMLSDENARHDVRRHAQTYIWHRAIQELAFYRQEGASLTDAIKHLWGWRQLLARSTLNNFVGALRLRLIGRIVLPTPLIRLVRS